MAALTSIRAGGKTNRLFRTAAPVSFLACVLICAPALAQSARDTVMVAYSIKSDWQTGFSAEITIRNDASWTIGEWTLSFQFLPEITSIWNARIVSRAGGSYVIGPTEAKWDDGQISPAETVTIGFVAAGSPDARPANARLNGAPVLFGAQSAAPAPKAATVVPAKPWPNQVFAPFVDVTAWPPVELTSTAARLSVRYFRVGFVVAQSATQPVPSWGGVRPADGSFLLRDVDVLRTAGGDVAIAFGGAVGAELAVAARSASELAAAYKSVIDAYGARVVDFDLEGASLADRDVVARRSEALATLQALMQTESRPLEIWLTLPLSPTGLTPEGAEVVRSAFARKVALRGVNGMAMDFGSAVAPNPDGRMGAYAIQAARGLTVQLQKLAGSHGSAVPRVGVTPMIGRNDVPGEIFHQEDAQRLLAFATANDFSLVSFWSVNRDRPCDQPTASANPLCSGIPQTPEEFSRIFRAFPLRTSVVAR
jgi:hypothetical protein